MSSKSTDPAFLRRMIDSRLCKVRVPLPITPAATPACVVYHMIMRLTATKSHGCGCNTNTPVGATATHAFSDAGAAQMRRLSARIKCDFPASAKHTPKHSSYSSKRIALTASAHAPDPGPPNSCRRSWLGGSPVPPRARKAYQLFSAVVTAWYTSV